MDTPANAGPATRPGQEGIVAESSMTLDEDLRQRLTAVAAEEQDGAERFQSSRNIVVESVVWVALGIAVWIIALAVWR